MPETTPDLARLETLERAATPGKWTISWSVFGDTVSPKYKRLGGAPDEHGWRTITADLLLDRDAEFLVALRNAAPWLLAQAREAERLRLANETLTAALDRLVKAGEAMLSVPTLSNERVRAARLELVAALRQARYGGRG